MSGSGRRHRKGRQGKGSLARAQAKRETQPVPICPTPEKLAFPEPGEALAKAVRASYALGNPYRAYECLCGNWHLTAKRAREGTAAASTEEGS